MQSNNRTRSLAWEEDAPAEPRFRRAQVVAPNSGRGLPGMPVEMEDPDGDEPVERRKRFSGPRRPWWRPASTVGRVALGLGASVLLAGVAIGYQVTRTFLTRDARFRIAGTENIQATGLAEVSRAELLPVFGEDVGRNIFFVPLKDRRAQLEQIPWVQRATVMRLLPDQIRVDVVEREPVAFVRQGGQIGLVDASGVLLTMPAAMMAQHHYSFPVLTGIDPAEPLASRKQRVDLYMRLMSELDTGGQHFSNQISEIDLTDPEDARVEMQEQGADILAHFGEDRFLERYQRYKAHIAEWRAQYPRLTGVDLRYDQQVVLQMAQGPAPDAAASAPAATSPTPAAQQPAPPAAVKSATAKNDAAQQKSAAQQKPAAKPASARAPETKSARPAETKAAKSTRPAETKAAKSTRADAHSKAKPHTAKDAAQQKRADRVRKIALEQRKRAEARRAAEKKAKPKTASKPQSPASNGQSE